MIINNEANLNLFKKVTPLINGYHFRLQDEWKKRRIELFFVEMSFFEDELYYQLYLEIS